MATSLDVRPLATDPLRSFKFNVIIPHGPFGTTNTNRSMQRLGFMSMQGLGVAIQALTYREGGDNLTTRKMPGQADFNPITLSRGLFPTDNDNWVWMKKLFTVMYGGDNNTQNNTDFRTKVYINILAHPDNLPNAAAGAYSNGVTWPNQPHVKVSVKLHSAWIGSVAYSDMDAGGNAVAVEQMTLNYEGFDMQWGGTGYVPKPTTW